MEKRGKSNLSFTQISLSGFGKTRKMHTLWHIVI